MQLSLQILNNQLFQFLFGLKIFVFLLLLILCGMVSAQTGQISGLLMDEYGPLPGANVIISGTTKGTVTDIHGRFLISQLHDNHYELVISYVGAEPRKIPFQITGGSLMDLGVIRFDMGVTLQNVDVVTSVRGKDVKAMSMIKASAVLVNVIAAEGAGKLPDRNGAEVIQRIPGANLEKDQGEGRYISFRGTPFDWSSATINGSRMPVADEESKTRALNFDILPTSLIEYVIVSKTLSADMEGDAIGGSVNFITRSAPTVKTFQANVGSGYNFKAGKPLYNISLLSGNVSKNKKWGYLIGGSWYQRNWATDNFQVLYGSNFDQSIYKLELREYHGQRTTTGLNISLEYSPDHKNKFFIKGYSGIMKDDEYNYKTMFNYVSGFGNSIKLQNIHNILEFSFFGGEVGGIHAFDKKKMKMEWKIGSYLSVFHYGKIPNLNGKDGNYGYYVNEWEMPVLLTDQISLDAQGNQVSIFDPNAVIRGKYLDIDSPFEGYGDPFNAIIPTYLVNPTDSVFKFSKAYTEILDNRDADPIVVQADIVKKITDNADLKFGAKLRYKEGQRKASLDYWDRDPLVYNSALFYTDHGLFFPSPDGGYLSEIGAPYDTILFPFLTEDVLNNFIIDKGDTLRYNPFSKDTPYYSNFIGSTYYYKETVFSAYVMSNVNLHARWFLNAGIRAEYTNPYVMADSVINDFVNSTVILERITAHKPYMLLLPSFNLKYSLSEISFIRLAGYRSFRRPNFNEMKPGQATIDFTNLEILSGNPELKPSTAWNLDLSFEHFIKNTGIAGVSLYYKYVIDHIYTAFETDTLVNNFQVVGGVVSRKYNNAPRSFAGGIELFVQSKLYFLPGILKNLGVSANYTYTFSGMEIESRNDIQPLPRQSRDVVNVSLFFDNDKLNLRVGMNYKSPYLYELNLYAVRDYITGEMIVVHQNNDFDLFVGNNFSIDASASFKFGKRFLCYIEANNLTNYPFVIYRGVRERPVKTEYYSVRGLIGIKYEL
jgi:outer membrane receptor protein involved in Fe transport